ncbi:MAG: glycosyltransferase, partial [Bacteroidia bacterium]
ICMKKRIFLAPMNWGLGHATRCIPLINSLLQKGCEVVLGGEGESLTLLTRHFPELSAIELPAYHIRYAEKGSQVLALLKQVPYLLKTFNQEQAYLQKLISQFQFDAVISDNRYGLHSDKVPTVFMTHQIAPIAPLRRLVYHLHCQYMKRFMFRWIPDFPSDSPHTLSASLSHRFPLPSNTYFLGALSQFEEKSETNKLLLSNLLPEKIDIVVVLSGPEPQRSLFAEQIKSQANLISHRNILLIAGKTQEEVQYQENNLTYFSHLQKVDLQYVLSHAKLVIARSGYSSLMDFASLGLKNVYFVPTTGQTEQEHLAEVLAEKNIAPFAFQKNFSILAVTKEKTHYTGFSTFQTAPELRELAFSHLWAAMNENSK